MTGAGSVIDEICHCGELRSAHADSEFEYGHGLCPPPATRGCFVWRSFVWETSPDTRERLTSEKFEAIRAIEDTLDERVPSDALPGLIGMHLGELRALAKWMIGAKKLYERAASEVAMEVARTMTYGGDQ